MEKAVLQTLIYGDIFDYPLKAWEVHKWLIKNDLDLIKTEIILERLIKKGKVQKFKDYYFLPGRKSIVNLRIKKIKQSRILLKKAHIVANTFKIIPWIKLVGISGGLALDNAGVKDDIDLFVITAKNRLWISRLLMMTIISVFGLRRKSTDKKHTAAGKICLNLILEEDNLAQQKKNIYIAHEILQMKPLWQRGEVYSRYLEENEWAFKFLPNWIGSTKGKLKVIGKKWKNNPENLFLDYLNEKAYQVQIQNMKPKGEEKISRGAVYFHPKDYGIAVLNQFKRNAT